jgi:hypothetical protein
MISGTPLKPVGVGQLTSPAARCSWKALGGLRLRSPGFPFF